MTMAVPPMRLVLLAALLIAQILPAAGAVLATATGAQQIVICRGDRLVTITVDARGEGFPGTPLHEAGTAGMPCLMGESRADPPGWAVAAPGRLALGTPPRPPVLARPDRRPLRIAARAPPFGVV